MAFPSTFLDLQNSVLNKGKLDDTYDTQRIKDWINQTYYQVCIETEFYVSSSATAALAAGATSASIPTTIVGVDFVVPTGSDGNLWGPMEQVTLEEILEQRAYNAGVTMTTGAPSRFAFRSSGVPTIEFWPTANGGEILTFYGQRFPPAMSGDTDVPIIPEPYASKLLEYGAMVQAAEFKREVFLLDFFQQQYIDWLQRFRGFTNTRVGDKTQQFRVETYKPYPRSNSVDTPYNW